MALPAYTPATESVTLPDGVSFDVRGLCLEDFAVLLRSHYRIMSDLFDKYVGEAALHEIKEVHEVLGSSDFTGIVFEVLETAPALIGDMIARAADETENPQQARMLPAGVQVDAVVKVVVLTLQAEGGWGKLMETIGTLRGSLAKLTGDRSP
jgi:hypothetical protein